MRRLPAPALVTMLALVLAIVSITWWTARPDAPHPATDVSPAAAHPAAAALDLPAGVGQRLPALQAGTVENQRALHAASRDAERTVVEAGRERLQGRYASERVDGAWALAKEQTLVTLGTSTQIKELGVQPTGLKATCRSSICLLEADFKSPASASDWFTLYTMNVGQEMPNVSLQQTTNPDGSVHVKLFGLARP